MSFFVLYIIFGIILIILYSLSKIPSNNDNIYSGSFYYIYGEPQYNKEKLLKLIFTNNKLIIDIDSIPYDKIKKIQLSTHKDIIEKEKSVILRSIGGFMIAGSLGAVIGGMSGLNNSKKEKLTYYLIIDYLNNYNRETQFICRFNNINQKDKLENIKNNVIFKR